MGRSQLARYGENKRRRHYIVDRYMRLVGVPHLDWPPNCYRVLAPLQSAAQADRLIAHMRVNGVQAIRPIAGWELLHRRQGYPAMERLFPNAVRLAECLVSLPCYPDMDESEIRTLERALETFGLGGGD